MKKITFLLGGLFFGLAGYSQQSVWTNNYQFKTQSKYDPNGITDVQKNINTNEVLRVDYYSEDFDSYTDFSSSPWTVQTSSGPVNWKLTSTGHANNNGNSFTIPVLQTSTPTKWAMVDSDGDGQGPEGANPENTELISPVINLQAQGAPTNLKLVWDQFFAEWNNDSCFVGVSTDNGATWDEVEVNAGVGREGRPNPEEMFVNISSWVAADPTNVQIRFRWYGAWDYGWQIDNIRITELPNNDITASAAFRSDWSQDILQYSKVPLSQVTNMTLGCEVRNIGFLDQNNIAINYRVFDPNDAVVSSGTSTQTINLLAGPSGTKDSIWINTGFTPTEVGQYKIEMVANGSATDDNPTNDTIIDTYFEVTDNIYAVDYGVSTSGFFNWANNNDQTASIGNLFEFNADGVIGKVIIGLEGDATNEGQLIYAQYYKYDANQQDFIYVDQSDDYVVQNSDLGQTVEVLVNSSGQIDVFNGDLYLIMAGHYGGNPAVGFTMAGKVQQGNVQGFSTDGRASLIDPSAPVVRINMQSFSGVEESNSDATLTVYPNPVTKEENLRLSLETTEALEVNIQIVDIAGKTISNETMNIQKGANLKQINVSNFPSGVYFMNISNADMQMTKKFVVK